MLDELRRYYHEKYSEKELPDIYEATLAALSGTPREHRNQTWCYFEQLPSFVAVLFEEVGVEAEKVVLTLLEEERNKE